MSEASSPGMTAEPVSGLCTVVTDDGRVVCERCLVADTPRLRMRGLLGRTGLPHGEGILIRPTNAIHMWFMRFAIDAVFLDGDGEVLRIAERLGPWRMAARRGAKSVLEVAAGTCADAGLQPGDRLVLAASRASA
jgi:uncharacterized protein